MAMATSRALLVIYFTSYYLFLAVGKRFQREDDSTRRAPAFAADRSKPINISSSVGRSVGGGGRTACDTKETFMILSLLPPSSAAAAADYSIPFSRSTGYYTTFARVKNI